MGRTVEARDKAHNITALNLRIAYQANIHSLTHDTSLSSSEKILPLFARPVHTWGAISLCKSPVSVSMVLDLSTCCSKRMQLKNETLCTKNAVDLPLTPPPPPFSPSVLSVAYIARTFHETSFCGNLACSKRAPASKLPLCFNIYTT